MRCSAAWGLNTLAGSLCFSPNPQKSHIKVKYIMQPMVNAVFSSLQSIALVPVQKNNHNQHQAVSSPLATPGEPRSVSWAAANKSQH